MAKCVFKQRKRSLWNIECGFAEYGHWSFCELPTPATVAVFLTGASISGVANALTKKYQKKLAKVTKLVEIVASALAVFEMSISKALNNGWIDEEEFNVLQTLYFKVLNELSEVYHKMRVENRNQFEKNLLEEINDIKSTLKKARAS